MNPPRSPLHGRAGRWLAWLVIATLGLAVGVVLYAYLSWVAWAPRGVILVEEDDPQGAAHARRLYALLQLLLAAALLILLFIVGAYLFIRLGRAVVEKPIGGKPTEYTDVWGSYRLTDEEVRAATSEGSAHEPGNARGSDSSGRPPPPPPPPPDDDTDLPDRPENETPPER